MDYYKLENIRSDTTMRDSIADTGSEPNSEDPVDDNQISSMTGIVDIPIPNHIADQISKRGYW